MIITPTGSGTFSGQLSHHVPCRSEEPVVVLAPIGVEGPKPGGELIIRVPLDQVRYDSFIHWQSTTVDINGFTSHKQGNMDVTPFPPSSAEHVIPMNHFATLGLSAIVNLAATGSTVGGFAVVRRCCSTTTTSTLNCRAGQTRANLAVVPIGELPSGQPAICVSGTQTRWSTCWRWCVLRAPVTDRSASTLGDLSGHLLFRARLGVGRQARP